MTDLHEAAERVRRVEAGESPTKVYPEALLGGLSEKFDADRRLLRETFARELDRTPVDEAWLGTTNLHDRGVLFGVHEWNIANWKQDNAIIYTITICDDREHGKVRLQCGCQRIHSPTRGDVRTAARLARITLTEGSKE